MTQPAVKPIAGPGRGQASHKRYWVVALGLALSFITYVDRAAVGQVAPVLSQELRLSPVQIGYVFAAFGLAYSAFEIPSGWLGDWIGPRKVLLRIVLWWSFFTAATGWARNFGSLLATRFLFGVGEAGCFPNLAKCFSTWLPRHERLRAEGLKAASARWGGAVTPMLFFYLQMWLGWRGVFQIFGAAGVLWAVVFYAWYRDDPRKHKGVNTAELQLIETAGRRVLNRRPTPWRAFLRSPSAWFLCTQWFCYSYGFYFYLTWLPSYLQQERHLNVHTSALLAGLPLFSAGLGSIFSGFTCARLMKAGLRIAVVRKFMAVCGFGFAAIMLLVSMHLLHALPAVAALAASSFAAELSGPVAWTTCMDLGGRFVGSLAGAMNTLGQLGGAAAPAAIGYILLWTHHDWSAAFYVSAVVDVCGMLCWIFMDPLTPLDGEHR